MREKWVSVFAVALLTVSAFGVPAFEDNAVCPYRQLTDGRNPSPPGPRPNQHPITHAISEQPLIDGLQHAVTGSPPSPAREKLLAELETLRKKLADQKKYSKDGRGNPDYLDDFEYNQAMLRLVRLVQEHFPHDRELMARALHEYLITEKRSTGAKAPDPQIDAIFIANLGPDMPARLASARAMQARGEHNLAVLTAKFSPNRTTARAIAEREAQNLSAGFVPEQHLGPNGELKPGHPDYFRAGELYASLLQAGHPLSGRARQLAMAYLHTTRALRESPQSFNASSSMGAKQINLLIAQLGVTSEVDGSTLRIPAGKDAHLAADRLRYLVATLSHMNGAGRTEVWNGIRDLYQAQAHLPIESKEVTAAIGGRVTIDQLISSTLPNNYEHPNHDNERSYRSHEYKPEHFDENGNLRKGPDGRPLAVRELGTKDWVLAGVVPPGKSANHAFSNYTRISYWARKIGPPSASTSGWTMPTNTLQPSGALRVIENWNGNTLESIEVMYRKQDGSLFTFFYRRDAKGKWALSDDFVAGDRVDKDKAVFKCMQCHAHGPDLRGTYSATPLTPDAAANLATFHGPTAEDTKVIQKVLQDDRAKVTGR